MELDGRYAKLFRMQASAYVSTEAGLAASSR
jgi:hypothetical protein